MMIALALGNVTPLPVPAILVVRPGAFPGMPAIVFLSFTAHLSPGDVVCVLLADQSISSLTTIG